ncbi:hypothetical protein O0L34_g549 [Tuta absoluta]|nr:hypothetical protein O0L34_g549 [Tuta absoluta]
MCQFVPAMRFPVMAHDSAKELNIFDSCIDIYFPDKGSSDEADTMECSTQTILSGKLKGKPSVDQKRETITGIKTMFGKVKHKKKHKIKYMDWRRFHRLKDIYDFIDELERDYPAICTVSVIGKSVEGRNIKMLKISNSDASNSLVWLDAAIHPREWISTAVVTYFADHIVRNFKKQPASITNKDWYIVPVLNPDGYEYTHTCNRMWRKNRACYGGECVGVDLNRNFSYGWGNDDGSSKDPNHVFYRGPAPFSEPESMAVRDTILCSNQKFKVFLSYHSYYELIIFPWGMETDPCPHYLRLLEGGLIMSRAIYESTGSIYKVGTTKDMTYHASGTSIDWSYAVAKIPYSYMIELRSKKYRFRLPKDQILETCVENWAALKSLMDYVDQEKKI